MPCLELTMPKLSSDKRKELAARLTEAFEQSTPYPADIFGIKFSEYSPGEVSTGGKLWDGKEGRPYIHFLLYCPRLSRSTKQKVVQSFSRAYIEVLQQPAWLPVIHLCEHPFDNVGVEGELLSDKHDECDKARFYYELGDES